jgi:hypothetical protein
VLGRGRLSLDVHGGTLTLAEGSLTLSLTERTLTVLD